jgi:hypothetical protein
MRRGSILDVGADLLRIQERLPHGDFGPWVKAECGLTERAALHCISAAALASRCPTISDLRQTTIWLLAGPTTPDTVREFILGRLNSGEVISDATIKKLINCSIRLKSYSSEIEAKGGVDEASGNTLRRRKAIKNLQDAVEGLTQGVKTDEQRTEDYRQYVLAIHRADSAGQTDHPIVQKWLSGQRSIGLEKLELADFWIVVTAHDPIEREFKRLEENPKRRFRFNLVHQELWTALESEEFPNSLFVCRNQVELQDLRAGLRERMRTPQNLHKRLQALGLIEERGKRLKKRLLRSRRTAKSPVTH